MVEVMISVEVVYAAVDRQALLTVEVPTGTTLIDAVHTSGIAQRFEGLDLAQSAFGIFGKAVSHPESHVMQAGDRIEIYRPLLADPKEVRRLRAERAAKLKKSQS